MSPAPGSRPLRFAVPERHRFRELQALEDAVNYRLARLMAPCARCASSMAQGRCDEHACDAALIAGYLEAAHAAMGALSRATADQRKGREPVARGGTDGQRA